MSKAHEHLLSMICRLLLPSATPKHASLTPLSHHHSPRLAITAVVDGLESRQRLVCLVRACSYDTIQYYPESAVRARRPVFPCSIFILFSFFWLSPPPIAPGILSPFAPTIFGRVATGRRGGFPGSHRPLRPLPGLRKLSMIQICFYFTRGPQEFRYPRHGSSKLTLTDLTSNSLKFSPFKASMPPLANVGPSRLSFLISFLPFTFRDIHSQASQDLRTSKPSQKGCHDYYPARIMAARGGLIFESPSSCHWRLQL